MENLPNQGEVRQPRRRRSPFRRPLRGAGATAGAGGATGGAAANGGEGETAGGQPRTAVAGGHWWLHSGYLT